MLLSIIVPVYNVEAYLPRCLRSLLDQDLDSREYEVIVINDGASDRSLEIAESYALRFSNIVVHSQENQGLGAARNAGIQLAKGKFLFFVDSDDYIASNVLAGLIEVMTRLQLQVLAFAYLSTGMDGYVRRPGVQLEQSQDTDVVTGMQYMAAHRYTNQAWGYILNREFLLDLGVRFEVGRFVEDVLFTANVVSAASKMAYLPVDVYRYVQRPGSIMHTRTAAHTKRLLADYERVVFGLEELRQKSLRSGAASTDFLDRLLNRQQAFVFFLIARLIRSEVPVVPILPEALERFRSIGMYPLTGFPGREFEGLRYRLLTSVFNRQILLWPFIRISRLAYWLRRLMR